MWKLLSSWGQRGQGPRMTAAVGSSVLGETGGSQGLLPWLWGGSAVVKSTLSFQFEPQSPVKVSLGLFSHWEPRESTGWDGCEGAGKTGVGHQFRDRFKTFLPR